MSPPPPNPDRPSSSRTGVNTVYSNKKPLLIEPRILRRFLLPQPDEEGDKNVRGQALVAGGSAEMPGAVILAAMAALRAGAGRLRIATVGSVVPWVATALPEARVFALDVTPSGAPAPSTVERVADLANKTQATLFGPGLIDEDAVAEWMAELLPRLDGPTLVLDAAALACLARDPHCCHSLKGKAVITPHAGEMASLLDRPKADIEADRPGTALEAARLYRTVVALKGAETFIASPEGDLFVNRTGNVGLATSGSGDTLAGIIAGLAARGAEPIQAALWGVYLHGRAGDRLARQRGPLGFLARELLDEIPGLMRRPFPNKRTSWVI